VNRAMTATASAGRMSTVSRVIWSRYRPVAGQHPELHEVDVEGVVEVADDAPDLGAAKSGPYIGACRVEVVAVDGPALGALLEREVAGHLCLSGAEPLQAGQPGRDSSVVRLFAGDPEPHHTGRGAGSDLVGEGHLLARLVPGEVDDEVETLGRGDFDAVMGDRAVEQAAV